MNYSIERKINFLSEAQEKRNLITAIIATIHLFMKEAGHDYVEKMEDPTKKIDCVFSVGGDGTMTHSIGKYLNDSPIYIGINAGNVGFLTPYEISDVFSGKLFSDLFRENRRIEERSLIQYKINDEKFKSVNEIAINPNEINQMIDVSMEVDTGQNTISNFIKAGQYCASTLLVSTATGSTAYNKNAGGTIIEPNMHTMQFTLIAPTFLGSRPIIFSESTKLKLIANRDLTIWSDGNKTAEVKSGDHFIVSIHENKAKILLPDDWNYFNSLSKKLHWNNGQQID